MRRFLFRFTIFVMFVLHVQAQEKAYQLYNKKGTKISYKKMMQSLEKSDVILFGEFHNNPISHWLELEVLKSLDKNNQVILGAEMFEADTQKPLSDYINNKITFTEFDSLSRLWNNYKTDYAPLVEYAKEKQIPFVATNIPRRFANRVYKKGLTHLESLTMEEKNWLAPLPIVVDYELSQYKEMLKMMGDHGSKDMINAQAIKDATMAYFILKNHQPNRISLHYNGAFHSDFYQGILWYLQQENNTLNYTTITTVEQDNIDNLEEEHLNRADFIICVPVSMTKTY